MPTNNLLEPSPYETDRGELIGRDPRKLTEAEVLEAGIELRVPTKAIRAIVPSMLLAISESGSKEMRYGNNLPTCGR
jgi:hypothetical protein